MLILVMRQKKKKTKKKKMMTMMKKWCTLSSPVSPFTVVPRTWDMACSFITYSTELDLTQLNLTQIHFNELNSTR